MCLKQEHNSPFNWSGVATILYFASFYDARYTVRFPYDTCRSFRILSSLVFPLVSPYGTYYSIPIECDSHCVPLSEDSLFNPELQSVLSSLVASDDFKEYPLIHLRSISSFHLQMDAITEEYLREEVGSIFRIAG